MNAAHIHLIVNHLPLFAALFGGALLAYGLIRHQRELKSVALVLGVIAGLGGVAATQSGERAEDVVEAYAGIDDQALEAHEEAAEITQWGAIALGLISLLGLAVPKRWETLRSRTEWAALLAFLVVFSMVARTANLGGPIRHPEITGSASVLDATSREDNDERH